jgi:hypothetical protein
VPDASLQRVTGSLARLLSDTAATSDDVRALASWAYHGGPQASEYDIDAQSIESLVLAPRGLLGEYATAPTRPRTPLDPSAEGDLPGVLDSVRLFVNQNAPGDLLIGAWPELHFLSEALWRIAPGRLIALAEETGN